MGRDGQGLARAALGVVLMVVLPAAGCKRGAKTDGAARLERVLLGPVSVVHDLTGPELASEGVEVDVKAIAREARATLGASKLFVGDAPDGGAATLPVARVRVELGLGEVRAEGKASARVAIRLRVDARPTGSVLPHWNEDIEAGGETVYSPDAKSNRNALFEKLSRRTLNDVLVAYIARQRLWSAPPAQLRETLTGDAGELRIEAIRAVMDRKLVDEVPRLLELLSDEDEAVRDAAMGALVELRDKRAVSVLAKQRSMRDRREMGKILDAIATLGGQEATDYLSFVADAHDDDEIREMAKAALGRLQRRDPERGAPGAR